MLTLKDVLTDKVDLDIECVDRVYLNGYVKNLQMPGGLINFIREQMGFPIPSPILLAPVSEAFRASVEWASTNPSRGVSDSHDFNNSTLGKTWFDNRVRLTDGTMTVESGGSTPRGATALNSRAREELK